jgi:hypothetical protein
MTQPNAYAALLAELAGRLGTNAGGRRLALPEFVVAVSAADLVFEPDLIVGAADLGQAGREARMNEESFALLVNQVPSGGISFRFDGRMVWEIYEQVLAAKQLAPRAGETAVRFQAAESDLRLAARASVKSPGGGTYYPTSVLPPSDLSRSEHWTTLRLDERDVARLTAAASPEVHAWLAGRGLHEEAGDAGLVMARLAVDVFVLQLDRSWLREEIFGDRGWTWKEGLLCDGATPPAGPLPGFVAGLVLARNLVIELRPAARRGTVTYTPAAARRRTLTTLRRRRAPTTVREIAAAPPRPTDAGDFSPAFPVPARFDVGPALASITAQLAWLRKRRAATVVRDHRSSASPAAQLAAHRRRMDAQIRIHEARAADLQALAAAAPAPADTFVLAVLDQPLPRCPDPDPALFAATT